MTQKDNHKVPEPEEALEEKDFKDLGEKEVRKLRKEFVFSGLEKGQIEKVERKDVVALDHVLEQIDPYVFCLQNYKQLTEKVEMDTGILLYGYAGAGKTHIVKYMVTASGAHFVNVIDFPKEKDSFSPADIKELFELSREYVREHGKPIVLFWDEFNPRINKDALKQLRVELDGIGGRPHGVLLVAASNTWPSEFSQALMRAGRIGTHVHVPLQKKAGREALLKYYASKKKLEGSVDFESLSYITSSVLAPSDIKDIVEKAWRDAHVRNLKNKDSAGNGEVSLTQEDLAKALLRNFLGTPQNVALSEEEALRIAVYEIGRAIVARSLGQPTQVISVPKFGKDMGARITDFELKSGTPIAMYAAQISVRWGGILAHRMCGIPPNDYGLSDSKSIKEIAGNIIVDFHKDFSSISVRRSGTGSVVSADIDDLIVKQKELAEKILEAYSVEDIMQYAKELVAREYLLQKDIDKFLKPFKLDGEEFTEYSGGLYL